MSDLSESLTVTLMSWGTWANRSLLLLCHEQSEQVAHSRCESDGSKSFKQLFKKSKWAKSDEIFALGHKKCEKLSKHMKKTNFRANHLFFARDLLESLSNHSHCSFLKSDKSDSLTLLFCKEWRERFAQGCSFVKSDVSKSLKVTH